MGEADVFQILLPDLEPWVEALLPFLTPCIVLAKVVGAESGNFMEG